MVFKFNIFFVLLVSLWKHLRQYKSDKKSYKKIISQLNKRIQNSLLIKSETKLHIYPY